MKLPSPHALSGAAASLLRTLGVPRAPRVDNMVDNMGDLKTKLPKMLRGVLDNEPVEAPPAGAQFLLRSFTGHAGTRPYKLYVPSRYDGRPMPLIVMLHGCTQSPDDFAAGTRMNTAAETRGFLVAWPAQVGKANMQKCWNWFRPGDQCRDSGEPALIAGITRQVMQDYAVDPKRVYVAGLSAGGAAAAIMGAAYPDLYAAIGVHSGLACGAARDMQSALAVMKAGGPGSPGPMGAPVGTPLGAQRTTQRPAASPMIPAIVFHGEQDTTVNPNNGDAVVAQRVAGVQLVKRQESGRAAGGHAWRRSLFVDDRDTVVVEQWVVSGAGHAWSGGSSAGSFTDPSGPDATQEMVRFFLAHPR